MSDAAEKNKLDTVVVVIALMACVLLTMKMMMVWLVLSLFAVPVWAGTLYLSCAGLP